MDFSNILDRIPVEVILLAVCISTGSLLLIPNDWIVVLRLEDFMNDYGKFIGIGFIGSVALLISTALKRTLEWLQKARKEASMKKAVRSSLDTLDNYEKAVLREFYVQRKHTIELPVENPTVAGLLQKGIISVVGEYSENVFGVGRLFPFSLSSFASAVMNPQLVDFPTGELTREQHYEIQQSRPSFADGKMVIPNRRSRGK